jgi:hypothetical protein
MLNEPAFARDPLDPFAFVSGFRGHGGPTVARVWGDVRLETDAFWLHTKSPSEIERIYREGFSKIDAHEIKCFGVQVR